MLAEVPGVGSVRAGTTDPARPASVKATAKDPSAGLKATKGVLSVGRGLSVDVAGTLSGRLEIRLAVPAPPSADALPGVLHVLDDGTVVKEPGWYDTRTAEIVVLADTFSDRFGAWYDPRNWAEEFVQVGQGTWDFVADWMTGRTDPPPCGTAPPWLTTSTKELSSVHLCTQENKDTDGTVRAEIYLKGNRNSLQVVDLPSEPRAYVWAQDQPDIWRHALARLALADPDDSIVIIGGDAMSVGLARPEFDTSFSMRVQQTWATTVANLLAGMFGGQSGDGVKAMLAVSWECVKQVGGLDPKRLDVVPTGYDDAADFVGRMVKCGLQLLTQPELAASVVDELLRGGGFGIEDRNVLVGRLRTAMDLFQETAKRLVGAINGVGKLTALWDSVFDKLAAGEVRGSLTGYGKTRVVEVAPVTESGRLVSTYEVTELKEPASCSPSSNIVFDGAAYRCFSGHGVYDPCWAVTSEGSTTDVLCLLEPWSRKAYRLTSDGSLPLPGTTKKDLSSPWAMELTTGEKCLGYQGSRSALGNRPIDYSCADGKFELLRGIGRNKPVWKVDVVELKKGPQGKRYEITGSRQVRTAWYGLSGQQAQDWRQDLGPTQVKQALQSFLDAWRRGDKDAMAKVSTASARETFDIDPAFFSDYRVDWNADCALSGTGSGFCRATLLSPAGGGITYLFVYRAVLGPRVLITEISQIGGGA